MGDWVYLDGTAVLEDDIDPAAFGFVYVIENLTDRRKYYGKKRLRFIRTKKLKGKKVKTVSVSDWKEYYGSSKELLVDVEKFGKDNFKRIILEFCNSSGECSYRELYYQMINNVLLHPTLYYNSFVGAKIHRKHVLRKKK